MSNWLAWLGSAIVALLAALFAVPAMIDWNGYRGVFEEEATRVLGREVRLGGNVNLRLLPAPYVSFERMRISDPDSQTGEPLFRAESFTMWLALSPLARGVLQANQVELKNPVLKLAVDESGTGNWSRLSLTPGSLPFVPADVTLSSVKVSNGEIGLVGPKGNEIAKLEAINGELTADALTGPVRFRGQMKWAGEAREVRFATTSPAGNGDIQFKLSATGAGSHSSYIVDGRAAGVGGKMAISGELSAKIAPDLSAATQPADKTPPPAATPAPAPEVDIRPAGDNVAKAPAPPASNAPPGTPLYELRSKVAGSADGFQLSEISITSQAGPPQLVTGDARVTWGERTRVDLTLNSRWIDLDAMFGTGQAVVPLEAARGLFDVLMRQLPASSDTNISLAVDQLSLGADQISNVRFSAVRAGGPLEVKNFEVGLPGATHLSLGGKLAPGESAPKFEGTIGLKGQNLARFLAWGMKQPTLTESVNDGPFALNGDLKFSGKLVELSQAKVGIGDTPVTADVRLDFAERRRLAVRLEGQTVDIGRIWPGGLQMETLAPLIARAGGKAESVSPPDGAAAAPAPPSWFDLSAADVGVAIRAGALRDGPRTLRDVEADVSVEGGKLAMRQLKFTSDQGLEVELEGEAANLNATAQGSVRGLVVVRDDASATAFMDIAGLDVHAPEILTYLKRMAPLRLAVTVDLGRRTPTAADLKIDGTIKGGRLIASADLDGGFPTWRTSPASITARIEASDIDQAISSLLALDARSSGARPGQILARATGTPQDGLLAFAAIESDGLMLDYSGKALLVPETPVGLEGSVKVASRDARALLNLAGVSLPSATASVPVNGTLAIASRDGRLALDADTLTLGGVSVGGKVTLTKSGTGATAVDGDLVVGDVTVPGLLAVVLDSRSLSEAPREEPAKGGKPAQTAPPTIVTVWPEQPFDFSAVEALDGKITLSASKVSLQPGLSLGKVRAEIGFAPGRLSVAKLSGEALGGTATSTMSFAKESAGVAFDGAFGLRVPQGEGKPDAANFAVKYAGRALSPAALIADLKGSGELKLADVSLGGMNPSIVAQIAEAALLGRGPQGGEPLLTALRDRLRQGQVKLGEVAMPITLADGNLKLAKIDLDRKEGRTTLETVVELATLKLDSEWTIEARLPEGAGPAAGKMLPPVSVIYAGSLQDVVGIEPQISVAALERELTVRKMERDVEELERLRKEDEKRAAEEKARIRAEQERLRQEKLRAEQERAAAAAAAAVDDPQPAPDPAAGPGGVEQSPLPPAGAQPQSSTQPAGQAEEQQAAGADATAPTPEAAAAQPTPRAPPRRRPPPPKENWNPFTQF